MSNETQKVIETIRKLTTRTVDRGCTEHEARTAMEHIGRLMRVYNLSMDMVFLGEAKCVTKEIPTNRQRRHPIDGSLVAIAEFCDCKVWLHNGAEKTYKIFGLETDTEMAVYLYQVIFSAMENETEKAKNSEAYRNHIGHRKSFTVSFQKGMAHRIAARLQQMTQERKAEENKNVIKIEGVAQAGSLVVVKNNKVQKEFEKLNLGLRKATVTHSRIRYDAYSAGKEAGERVNLRRPIGNDNGGQLRLTNY